MANRLAKQRRQSGVKTRTPRKRKAPEALAHLIVWYLQIRRQTLRGYHFEPMQFSEITHYGLRHGLEISSFETDMLCELDAVWQKVQPKPDAPPDPKARR